MMSTTASRLTFAALVISAEVFGTCSATNCCVAPDGAACCPKPAIETKADNFGETSMTELRVVYDPDRCCPDGIANVGCAAYGAVGCISCRDVCDERDTTCVTCPVVFGGDSPAVSRTLSGSKPRNDPPVNPEDKNDLWVYFEQEEWTGDEITTIMEHGSYDFGQEPRDYDCSACAWDNMSVLKKRLLTQRSRSMVCDSSCLHDRGDADYGVTLCNYFNEGKECRACCHEGHLVEGCMPCEGSGSCDACVEKISDICLEHPCGSECQAYVCCSMHWGEYSGCVGKMSSAMAQLASHISERCPYMFTCDNTDLSCSDNARTCNAHGSISRRLQEESYKSCAVITVDGAGSFDTQYASAGSLDNEVIFNAVGSRHASYALKSVAMDVCTHSHTLPFIGAASTDIIVARSSSGRLAWDDGTEPHPHATNTEAGCARHVWLLQDTTGEHSHAYITVDPSEHPRYITSDWVKVHPGGSMTRSELTMSCSEQKGSTVWL